MQSWTNTCLSPSLVISIILLPDEEDAQVLSLVDTGTEIPDTTTCHEGFSVASDIINEHRCRLLPENAETTAISGTCNIWIYHLMLSDSFWLWCCFTLILKSGSGLIGVHKSGQIWLRPDLKNWNPVHP